MQKGVLRNFTKEACNFFKKEPLAQVFSCEFCEISKNTFLTEHVWTTASNLLWLNFAPNLKVIKTFVSSRVAKQVKACDSKKLRNFYL